ncbi:MAG: glycine C-acetyltransferase [Bacillota bacterium]
MSKQIFEDIRAQLTENKTKGLYKNERVIVSPQQTEIEISSGEKVLNFCANNYLGLSDHPEIIETAQKTMGRWGYGLSSVRFICGTLQIHKELEQKISEFLKVDDTLLYAACFDANSGVFEPLLGEESAIISDQLNHASVIDGVRLCKAKRLRYAHSDMDELEKCLQESQSAKYRIIATDGVFSMDGDMAKLPEICELAKKHDALTLVDDSHATGYIGKTGRGTPEYFGLEGEIDIITTTFGKSLGGAMGGCTAGRNEIIEMLRQSSRPYLFSNSLAPAIVGGTLKALDLLMETTDLQDKVMENANYFREKMLEAGFTLVPGETAIVPVMLYDEPKAMEMADLMLKEGIYVIGFVYPVVPKGKARIRVQLSAAHKKEHIDKAISAFIKAGKEVG